MNDIITKLLVGLVAIFTALFSARQSGKSAVEKRHLKEDVKELITIDKAKDEADMAIKRARDEMDVMPADERNQFLRPPSERKNNE